MRRTGYILQYSPTEQRGTIHLGGNNHSALLGFAYSDCDKKVRDELQRGEIPRGSAIPVTLDIGHKEGCLMAIGVHLAAQKSADKIRRASKSRASRHKKTPRRRKR